MPEAKKQAPRIRRNQEKPAAPKKGAGLRRAANKAKEGATPRKSYDFPVKPPEIPAGVVPAGVTAPVMATDSNPYAFAAQTFPGGGFPGFPYLSQLATRAEYRQMASGMATEITREWLEFTSKQDDDTNTAEKIKAIEEEFKRLNVRGVIQKAAEQDCYFGRAQIFLEIAGADRSTPLVLDPRTVKKGSLARVVPVEAVWTTPAGYNALDPAAPDFYKPSKWFMLGQEVHASRLLTVVTRQLPDILKPAFNFAGMSLSQLAEPYVDNWLRTRQSVSDLLNNFSITALATSMDQVLQGDDDGADLFARAELFTATRSNKGLMLLDKDREDLVQINTPLSGLHELQAQSQEHMCSVSRMPAIILTGISPSGLNASSDGEICIFYDWIAAQQETHWREPLEVILKAVQLSLFGEIDPDIDFTFVPLYQMTPKELAEIRLSDSQAATAYIAAGVIDPSEERERLARDPDSGYQGLDTTVELVPPTEPPPGETDPAMDAEFDENKHPRADNGQFGSGGGGAAKPKGGKTEFTSVGPKLDFSAAKSASVEDVKAGNLKNIKYDSSLTNEAEAGYGNGTIRVGDKFFALSPSHREHVLRHEQAHYDAEKIGLSTSIDIANAGVFGELSADGSVKNGPNGQHKPDECLTESLALYQTDPEFLKAQFPEAYELAESYYKSGKLPESLLSKIATANKAASALTQNQADLFDRAEREIRDKIKSADSDESKLEFQLQLRALMLDDVYPDWFAG